MPEKDIFWTPIKEETYYVVSMVDVQAEGNTLQ
jgi:hypothetical protein